MESQVCPKLVSSRLSLEQERSMKSHKMGTRKPFVSCGFVDRLTWQEDLKIGALPNRRIAGLTLVLFPWAYFRNKSINHFMNH